MGSPAREVARVVRADSRECRECGLHQLDIKERLALSGPGVDREQRRVRIRSAGPLKIVIIVKPHQAPRRISIEIDSPLGVEDLVDGEVARLCRGRVRHAEEQAETRDYDGAPQAMNSHIHTPRVRPIG